LLGGEIITFIKINMEGIKAQVFIDPGAKGKWGGSG
jgi:hypothetical protein